MMKAKWTMKAKRSKLRKVKSESRGSETRISYERVSSRSDEGHHCSGWGARPTQGEYGGDYFCSCCGASAYYDGRCGDGPILMCGCDAAEMAAYANDRR